MRNDGIKRDEKRQTITIPDIYDDEDGEITLVARWEVCGRCSGRGVHDPIGFSDGFSSEGWEEMCAGDPDFPEDYSRGLYDVRCEECDGRTTTLVVDLDRNTAQALDHYYEYVNELSRSRQEAEAERRMGA